MPRYQQVRGHLAKGLLLVYKDLQGESGVQIRVVDPASFELPVLIVLDQMMIRIARKGQGIEHQRIHSRKLQESHAGIHGLQMGQIEGDQVVA